MALKDIFNMIKADRYTADGREELIKAHAEETEDRTYNIGEISQKTGLQKTANGWVKPTGLKGLSEKGKEKVSKNVAADPKIRAEGLKELAKRSEIAKQADFEKKVGDPAKEREQYWKEIKEASEKPMPGVEEIYNKTVGSESESKPESKPVKSPSAPKPSVQEYIKAKDTVKKYDETYKKQLEEYENGQRLRANGGGAILNPMYGLKPNDLSKNEDYMKAKDIIQRMEAKDSAPRVLTGDTKIRIRK